MASLTFSLLDGLLSFAAALLVFIGGSALGAIVGPAQYRLRGADAVVGFGAATGLLTMFGVTFRIPLAVWATLLAVTVLAAGVVLVRRRDAPGGVAMWITLVALTPLLLVVSTVAAAHSDELRHWLLVAEYFYRVESFPRPDLPPSLALLPAYPQAWPLMVWLVSLLAGRWTESSGAMLSVLLLGSFVPTLVAVVREVRSDLPIVIPLDSGAMLIAAGLILVLPLNPGFDRSFSLTALADVPTAAALAVSAVLGWLVIERLRDEDHRKAAVLALQFGIATAYLLNLKQANLVLAVLLFGAFGLLLLRDPRLSPGAFLRLLPRMLLPSLVVYCSWRIFVGAYIPAGEVVIQPPEAWRVRHIPEIVGSMVRQMAMHPMYFVLLMTLTILGLVSFVKASGPVGRLLAIIAVLWIGYTAFLGFVYVTSLSDDEALRAAEFWRYSTHLSLLGIAGGVAIGGVWWPRRWCLRRWAGSFAVATPIAASLGLVLMADQLIPSVDGLATPFRAFGRELADILPDGARVAIVAPWDCGLLDSAIIYELTRSNHINQNRWLADSEGLIPSDFELDSIALAHLDKITANHVAVLDIPFPMYCSKAWIDPLAPMQMVLLARTAAGWRQIGRWRVQGHG
jgi:hypothetical protein